ncbi:MULTISPECIES: DUF881 domain-containing protein [Brevibacillus]|uniref:DUF881 domain-containing protein n=1 Tax=Brevibacillus borstelensis AK1 TaxID=1300222 RepID=M8DDT3_9BACL|nr:DUF881 domain-containing protein [Brevibacillus borstelensis]EMT54489.1 hypothetical protein I532_02755 [Brevibacillus borstelensis AK1]KKX54406.1 hypothetical protein X546_15375 [Brevibacillus borstelensis cifa_chp40]MBE5395888.1 DUF881 domain-containing protein [Brevibacillus borstelensis]MCC0563292.1 DUF881 domain-containing protein [Brevibacillus borstelensis]MCM3471235.1 DUF881 domain-containing protein [Brevibacillus borstelensis]
MLQKSRKITFILAIISAIIGVMLTVQLRSSLHPAHKESRSIAELRTSLQKELEKHKNLLADISKYNQLYYQYETALNEDESLSVMKEELARNRKMAGMVSVEGEGIILRVVDAQVNPAEAGLDGGMTEPVIGGYTIDDEDLRWLVNILFANGSQAVSINGHRMVATTPIRYVGNAIQIDTRTIQPPYELKALGEPDVLLSALKLEGVEENFRLANKEIIAEKRDKLIIPANREQRPIQYMKPVKEKGES